MAGWEAVRAENLEIPPNIPPKWRDTVEPRHHLQKVRKLELPDTKWPMSLNESIVEDAALEWFGELGYAIGHGPEIAPGEPAAERESFEIGGAHV